MPAPRSRLSLSLRLLLILTLAYLGWCTVLFIKQDSLIFPTALAGPGLSQLPRRRDFEQAWITAPDGVKVEGWFFRTRQADPPIPKPCIIVFHGNGELIDTMQDYADFFLPLGLNVLLVEYRGYARSGGAGTPIGSPRAAPSQQLITADSLLFIDWLAARPDIDTRKLILYGRSLGAGVAAQLAAHSPHPPAAVILESPFTSIAAFAAGFGAPAFILKHPFRTDEVLPPLAAAGLPVLIISSRTDEIVPFSHAEKLKALMPTATLCEITGPHSAVPLSQPTCEQALFNFLAQAGITDKP